MTAQKDNTCEFKAYDLRVMASLKSSSFVDSATPELSWKIAAARSGFRQSAYRIKAASSPELLQAAPDLWDSGRIESGDSLKIRWDGKPLRSRAKCHWRVSLWDEKGNQSEDGEIGMFEVALLNNSDWNAKWIHFSDSNPNCSCPCPYFRREFQVNKIVCSARLYVSARGLFEAEINGRRIGEDHFVPGWTDFKQQLQYMSYDVTNQVQQGGNALCAVIGDGWYCGYLTNQRRRDFYGSYPELLMQLELLYADGSGERIVTDESWKTTTGPILYSDIYDGEMYDARLEMPGWDRCGFDDSKWRQALLGEAASESPPLVQKCCPPVRRVMEIKAVKILKPQKDIYIWDFGQNISGRVKLKIKGYRGGLCTLRFGEMLNPDGSLYNLNYRSARSTDYYVCPGPIENENAWWEPRFTFHGFRYVQIDGFQYFTGSIDDVEAIGVVIHSDLEITGNFECGLRKVNQLYSNILWGQRDNFLEIPTDCPQRDERLGWTGDAQLFAETASFNMNVDAFFRKWTRDAREAQRADGAGACCAPAVLFFGYGAAGWSDALVIVPYMIYKRYGDVRILKENFAAMKKWIDYQNATSNSLIRPETCFGDWLASDPLKTPSTLIGTAYFAFTCGLFATVADVLGEQVDAAFYRKLADQVKNRFRQEFLDTDGLLKPKNQTSCTLAIAFDLLTDDQRLRNGCLLKALIEGNNGRLSTGFIGTACLLQALSMAEQTKTAYDLLLQEECPSWLFSVNQGATTVWERWDSFSLEKGFGDVTMNSFNHYAYGAVGSWMASIAGGIDYSSPAGKELLFAAYPDRRLKYVRTSLETPYGTASSYWAYDSDTVTWRVAAPANTCMRVFLPVASPASVRMNGESLKDHGMANNKIELTLPCGEYEFIFPCTWC